MQTDMQMDMKTDMKTDTKTDTKTDARPTSPKTEFAGPSIAALQICYVDEGVSDVGYNTVA
jgi:hypothetical protein